MSNQADLNWEDISNSGSWTLDFVAFSSLLSGSWDADCLMPFRAFLLLVVAVISARGIQVVVSQKDA